MTLAELVMKLEIAVFVKVCFIYDFFVSFIYIFYVVYPDLFTLLFETLIPYS